MNDSPPSALLSSIRALVLARWLPLVVAIALTAAADGALWIAAQQLASSTMPGAQGSEASALLMIDLTLALVWAIVVSILVLPMVAAMGALSDDSDTPAGWIPRALSTLPGMWLRLAIPTFPILLLGVWSMHSVFGMLESMGTNLLSGTAPDKPLALSVSEAVFGTAPGRWLVFIAIVGLWFLWSATHATRRHDSVLPQRPWQLFGRNPAIVGGLVLASAVVLGPVLSRAFTSLGSGLIQVMPTSAEAVGAQGTSTLAIIAIGGLVALFVGAISIPWVALFSDEHELPERAALADVPAASGPHTEAPAPAPMDGAPQVSELMLVTQPGQLAGAWWFLRAGSHAYVQVAGAPGAPPPTPAVLDANGQWQTAQPTQQPGTAAFAAPADGWFQLGAWVQASVPTQIALRLTVPADAQPAPVQAQQGIA